MCNKKSIGLIKQRKTKCCLADVEDEQNFQAHKTEIKTTTENNLERVSRTNDKISLFKKFILNGTQSSLSCKKTRSARDAENGDTSKFPAE